MYCPRADARPRSSIGHCKRTLHRWQVKSPAGGVRPACFPISRKRPNVRPEPDEADDFRLTALKAWTTPNSRTTSFRRSLQTLHTFHTLQTFLTLRTHTL